MVPLRLLALGAALSVVGCASAPAQTEQHDEVRGKILVVVTVDWEGRDLTDANIGAMEDLRVRRPDVPIVQFLNAAYFTKPGADADATKAQIERALGPDDELGLHVHGWKRLFEAAGVEFRNTPTFWDPDGVVTTGCSFDCGHEVPISAYDEDELEKVVAFSVRTLDAQGFGRPTSFRAGGWMAKDNVQSALVAQGFVSDSSAVPSELLASEIGDLPLFSWVDALWKGTTTASQPYVITTERGPLVEIPDNGALADYMLPEEMVAIFHQARETLDADPGHDVVVSIGFHQETAERFLPRVDAALDAILRESDEDGVPVRFVTASELAAKR